jgi:hypothetical protein
MKPWTKLIMIDQVRLAREIVATFRAFRAEWPTEPAVRRLRRAVVSSWRRIDTIQKKGL